MLKLPTASSPIDSRQSMMMIRIAPGVRKRAYRAASITTGAAGAREAQTIGYVQHAELRRMYRVHDRIVETSETAAVYGWKWSWVTWTVRAHCVRHEEVSYVAPHRGWSGPALQAISAPGRARGSMRMGGDPICGNLSGSGAAKTCAISSFCAFGLSLPPDQLPYHPRAPPSGRRRGSTHSDSRRGQIAITATSTVPREPFSTSQQGEPCPCTPTRERPARPHPAQRRAIDFHAPRAGTPRSWLLRWPPSWRRLP